MNDETTLITGASSGIGLHLAHEFAKHGHPLVIVAPVAAELEAVAEEVRAQHGVSVQVIAKDLERPEAAKEVYDEVEKLGTRIAILVNNAGRGAYGKWWQISLEEDLSMLRLNVEAVLRLTKLFLPDMLRRNRGRILNTASMAGFEPFPLMTTYASTKAFVLSFSEALAVELKETPITVTALCPGVTDTDFFPKAEAEGILGRQNPNVMAPQDVAKTGYEALMSGELFVVPGLVNKILTAARRILPVETQAKINEKVNSPVAPDQQTHVRGEKEYSS